LLVGVQRDLVLEDQENEPPKQNGMTKISKEYIIGYPTVTCMFGNDQQKNHFSPSRCVECLSDEREGELSAV